MSEPIEGASYDKATIDEPKYARGGQIEGPKDSNDDSIPAFLNGGCYYPVRWSDAEIEKRIAQAKAQTDATD